MKPNPGSDEAINVVEWRPIPGYEERYQVSNLGEVRSMNWEGCTNKIKLLKRDIRKGRGNAVGYYSVRLHIGKSSKTVCVGRLVLSAFVRLPNEREEQNHINGDTLDDRLENLEWVTRSENQKHAIANGLADIPSTLGFGKRYWWKHSNGDIRYETPSEMARLTDSSSAPFFKMVSGKEQPYRSFHGWTLAGLPNPGSYDALKHNCSCPVIDNAHGRRNDGLFWITADCPVHGVPHCATCGHELEAVRPGKWQCNWCEGGRFERLAQAERMMQV